MYYGLLCLRFYIMLINRLTPKPHQKPQDEVFPPLSLVAANLGMTMTDAQHWNPTAVIAQAKELIHASNVRALSI